MNQIKNITLVGTGNVGSHLAKSFASSDVTLNGLYSRTIEKAQQLASTLNTKVISDLNDLDSMRTDLVLVCVPDDAVGAVIEQIPKHIAVAYTSGSVKLNELPERALTGVFYPLQTFSEKRKLSIAQVPFLIESNEIEFGKALHKLAEQISTKVIYADSNDRYQLHIAAVIVNNFTNHLYTIAEEHVQRNNLDFDLLHPLIHETVNKLKDLSPEEAQTGPAKRGDKNVIQNHINSLTGQTKEIYALLSESILEKYEKK